MLKEYVLFDKVLSPEYCDFLVAEANKIPKQNPGMGVDGKTVSIGARSSKIAFINKMQPQFSAIFDLVWTFASIANKDFGFKISKLDYIQFSEYSEYSRGEYKKHHDVFWLNNDPQFHRKLSVVVQLTDPLTYEGGDLEIYDINTPVPQDILKNKGSLIVFPSFLPHAALPVTKGTRYSLAAWIDGPKWS